MYRNANHFPRKGEGGHRERGKMSPAFDKICHMSVYNRCFKWKAIDAVSSKLAQRKLLPSWIKLTELRGRCVTVLCAQLPLACDI